MYESEITVNDFVNTIVSQLNVTPELPIQTVVAVINELQEGLYFHVIRPIRCCDAALKNEQAHAELYTSEIPAMAWEDSVRNEDVVCIYSDEGKIIDGTVDMYQSLSLPVFCRINNAICIRNVNSTTVSVTYVVRPLPIQYDETSGYIGKICMPPGYVSMLQAGVLAELYRRIGDSENCNRFTEKYNAMLSDLKKRFLEIREGDADATNP